MQVTSSFFHLHPLALLSENQKAKKAKMIPQSAEDLIAIKNCLKAKWDEKYPNSCQDLVKDIVSFMPKMSSERVSMVDYGDYHDKVFIVGSNERPAQYWYASIDHDWCYHCDNAHMISHQKEKIIQFLLVIALEFIQKLHKMEL